MLIFTFFYFLSNSLFFLTLPYFLLLNYDTGRTGGGSGGTFASVFLGGFFYETLHEQDGYDEGGVDGRDLQDCIVRAFCICMQVDIIIIIIFLSLSLSFPILFIQLSRIWFSTVPVPVRLRGRTDKWPRSKGIDRSICG